MKIGFIGLGVMGGPMAANIVKAGHQLTVYDRSPQAVEVLVKLGARSASCGREVGAASDFVVTMLPEPQHVEQAVLGPDGVVEGLPKGGIVIEMSTIDPGTSRRVGDVLRARGMELVDSPVGKTSEHAVTGTLTLMVGGNQAAIDKLVDSSLVATHHQRERAGDGVFTGLADGRVDQLHAARAQYIADAAGRAGIDGAHLNDDPTLGQTFYHAIRSEDRLLHMLWLGQHGDDEVAGSADLAAARGAASAQLDQYFDRLRAAVIDGELMPRLDDVGGHGASHHTEADESDFHNNLLLR